VISFNTIKSVVLSRGANAVLQYIVIILYGTFLSSEKFGELSLLMILVGISFALIDFGSQNTVVINTLGRFEKQRLQFLNIISALLVSLFLIFFSDKLVQFIQASNEFWYCCMFMPIFLCLHSISIVPYARLLKAQKLISLAWVDFLGVLSIFISVPLFLYIGLSLFTFIIALSIQAAVRILLLKLNLNKLVRLRFDLNNLSIFKKLLVQFLSNLIVYISFRIDQIVVVKFISIERLGEYSFLKQLLSYPINIISAIYSQTVVPYFSRYRNNKAFIIRTLLRSLIFILTLIILYYIILYFMPPPFEAISKIWNFSSILSICLMLMCVSRIILDCIIITAVATGNVLGQLKRNTLLLIINSLLSPIIIFYSLEAYLIVQTIMIIIFCLSIFRYIFISKTINAT